MIWNPKFEKHGEILLNCVYFLIFGTKLDILPILAEISVNRWKLADIIESPKFLAYAKTVFLNMK